MVRIFPWLLGLALAAPATFAVGPEDFGPDAVHIHFDDLTPGQAVDDQYLSLGVRLTHRYGALQAIDPSTLEPGIPTQSPPLALLAPIPLFQGDLSFVPQNAIDIRFTSGQDRVGLYFRGSANGVTGTLEAYDAEGDLLTRVSVTGQREGVTNFIAIDYKPGTIRRVVFTQDGPELIDALVFEPGGTTPGEALQRLRDQGQPRDARLTAMDQLLLSPSPKAVDALRALATDEDEPDLYLRERAVIALEQLRARAALPDLLRLGRHPHRPLALAAYNAAWTLREAFPPGDPPQLQLELLRSTRDPDDNRLKVLVVGKVVSGDSDLTVEAALAPGKGGILPKKNLVFLNEEDGNDGYRYEGPIAAGRTVALQAEAWFEPQPYGEARPYVVQLRVKRILSPRDGQTIGDFVTYEARLHLDPEKGIVVTPGDDQATPVHEVGEPLQGGLY